MQPGWVKRNQGTLVLVMLFLFQTLNFFDKLVYGLSAVPLMRELQITPQQYGLIGSSFFLLFSLSGTLVGLFLIGRMSPKWIVAILAVIWSASQIPVFFTSSIAVLTGCRILLGAGEGPGLPTALHSAYDWFPKEKRSVPSAVILQGISVGFLVGSPFLTTIIVGYGWRYGFLACGLLGLVWLAGWLVIGGEGPYAASNLPAAQAQAAARVPARKLWLDPSVIGVMIMSFMSYWVVGMSAIWLPPYLQIGLGYKPVAVGWIISAIFAFQSLLLLVGSWLCQSLLRRGVRGRTALGHASTLALMASGLALLAAVHSGGVLQLVLIAFAFAAPSLTTIYGPVILGNVAPAAQRGTLVVVIYSANALAALVSNYVTGLAVGAAGADTPLGFTNGMTIAAAMLLAGAAASLVLVFPERTAARFERDMLHPLRDSP